VKITRIAMFGVGYVLGAKAGRERYQQIVTLAQGASKRLEKYGNRSQPADDEPATPVDASGYVDGSSTSDGRSTVYQPAVDDFGER
jgi:hypothetical protein